MTTTLRKLIEHVRAGGTLAGAAGEPLGPPAVPVLEPPTPVEPLVGDGRTADALVSDVADARARVERLERHIGLADDDEEVPVRAKKPTAADDPDDDAGLEGKPPAPKATRSGDGDSFGAWLDDLMGLTPDKGQGDATER